MFAIITPFSKSVGVLAQLGERNAGSVEVRSSNLLHSTIYASVAQLDRATGCGPVGRGFESLRARHFYTYFKIILQNLEYSRAVMFRVFGKKHIVKKMIEN